MVDMVVILQLIKLQLDKMTIIRLQFVIIIVNSRFLERPQAKLREPAYSQGLTRTKSISSGQNPESQAGRQSGSYGGWCLELRRGGRYGEEDELG